MHACVYVAEFHNHCTTKLTTTGEHITRIGSKGLATGQLYFPTSLTINNNLVYGSEFGNAVCLYLIQKELFFIVLVKEEVEKESLTDHMI